MKYFLSCFFGALFFYLIIPSQTVAAVRINEVAWMGTAASQYSEWIELYNDGASDVSLAGWTIYKTGDELLFTLSKTITAGGYLLVERTTASAPDAVPGINDESGSFSNGGLRNSGEDLTLKDQNGNPINILPYAAGWPAGDAKTKDTMQWTGEKWITAAATPDAINATVADSTISIPSSSSSQTASPEVTAPVVSETITPPAVVAPTPVIDPIVTSNPPAAATTPATSVPATTQPQTETPEPVVTTPNPLAVIATVDPIQTTIETAKPAVSKSTTVTNKTANKKSTLSKSAKQTATGAGKDTAANDAAADQLHTPATAPKESNHLKIIIFAAVAFIGMALFLLLDRLKSKVSQE